MNKSNVLVMMVLVLLGITAVLSVISPETSSVSRSSPSFYISQTTYQPARSTYPTMALEAHTFTRPNPGVYTLSEPSSPFRVKPSDVLKQAGSVLGQMADAVRDFLSLDWLSGRAAAATFTASQTGPWDIDSTWGGAGLACVYNVTCPGTGDQADINGFTVTVRTSVSVFKVNANAANSIFVIDPTINAANITFTFDDTALAGFTCSSGLGGLRIYTAGTGTYSVTINSSAAPPTNFWGVQTSVTCWQFAAAYNLNYTTLTDSNQPSIICANDEICTHTALTLKRTSGSPVTPNFQAIGNAMTRLVNPVFDNSYCCGVIATPRVLFLDGPLATNGGSLTAGNAASAAPGLLAYRDFAGTVNDYRFVFGNTFDDGASGMGPQDLASGDRPDATDDVTWGSALSAEKGRITISQTWNTLTIGGSTMLRISGSIALVIDSGGLTVGGGRTLIGSSATITVNGNWSTSAGTFTIDTSRIVMDAAGTLASATLSSFYNLTVSDGTITVSNNIDINNDLIVSGGVYAKGTTTLNVDGALTLSGGNLTSTSGTATVAGAVNVSSVNSGIDFGSEDWIVSGEWTNETTDASAWDRGSGSMLFDSTTGGVMVFAGANIPEDEFWAVTFASSNAATQTFTMESRGLRIGGALVIDSTTSLAKETYSLTVGGAFTLGAGEMNRLTSISGTVSITGAVLVDDAAAYIDFGSETWTVGGTWTTSTTSASWDAGTGSITFTSAIGGTMNFAGASLSEAEFNSVTFTSSAATAQTFTMSAAALRWLTTLTISDASSTTTLATMGLTLGAVADTANLVVGNGGTLTANDSTLLISGVSMTGGTSGTITVTTGTWLVGGDWNTTGVGSTYTQGTGLVEFTATATITMLSTDNTFDDLTISADTTTLASNVQIQNALLVSGGSGFLDTDSFSIAAGTITVGAGGTFTADASLITVAGNWDSSAGEFNHGTSTIIFIASGSLSVVGNNIAEGPYNLTIFAGQTVTISVVNTWIYNVLTVNGTLVGATPQTVIFASGVSGSNMLVLGGSADMDDSGYLILRGRGPCGTTYMIPSALYEHLGVQGGNSACAYTFNLGGNISTPSCGVFNECAILLSSEATLTPAAFFTFNTMNYDIFAGGTLWFGDGTTTGGTFNLGSSDVEAYGINPAGSNIVVNLQTSSVIAHPSSTIDPIAFYTTFNSIVNGNSATVSVRGQLRLGYGAGVVSGIVAGSSTWYVLDDEGSVTGYGSPGEVNIVSENAYIQFGTSTWTVEHQWTNNSTSASWDAGTGTVTFDSPTSIGHYFGCTRLVEDEFFDVLFRSSAATPITVALYDDFYDPEGYGCLNVAGTLEVSDSVSTTTLITNSLPVSAGTFSVETNGIFAAGTSDLTFSTLNVFGGTMTIDGEIILGSANFSLSISSGTLTITEFVLFDVDGRANLRWTQSASVAGGTLTVSFAAAGRLYLYRNDILLDPDGEVGVVFTFTGGWGVGDDMRIGGLSSQVLTTGYNWFLLVFFLVICVGSVWVVWRWKNR